MESPQVKKQTGMRKFWVKFKSIWKPKASPTESSFEILDSPVHSTVKSMQQTNLSTTNTLPPPQNQPITKDTNLETPQPSTTAVLSRQADKILQPHSQPEEVKSHGENEIIEVDSDNVVDINLQSPDSYQPGSTTAIDPAVQRADIAKDLYSRYGIKLDAADLKFKSRSQIERVEKKPRLRVRWTCHKCESTFGREKTCPNCTHPRCSSCVRYPPKRQGSNVKKTTPKTVPAPVAIQRPTTGACHECKTTFDFPAAECQNCRHQICERCLKESIEEAPLTSQLVSAS